MEKFFSGRDVKLLTDEKETSGIYVWKLNLEEAEIGHMSCRIEDGVTFLYAEQGWLLCQVNQEQIWLGSGEGMFINNRNAYRFIQGQEKECHLWVIQVETEYLKRNQEIYERYIQPLFLDAKLPYMKFSEIENRKQNEQEMEEKKQEKKKQRGKQDAEIYIDAEQGNNLLRNLNVIQGLVSTREEGYELLLTGKIFEIWRELYLGWKKFSERNLSEKDSRSGIREKAKLCRMLLFLHEHYREKVTLAQMAADSGVSTGEYCRFFKKKMQQTPVEYLQCYRVECTLRQLLDKERSEGIGEIALEHGFTGASYYSEIFKKEMGCAPGDYRKWYYGETDEECPLKSVKSGKN